MLALIFKGGPVMIPIILGSVLGLAIIIDKFWHFHTIKMDIDAFAKTVFNDLRAGRIKQALQICRDNSQYPLPATFKAGIENINLPLFDLEKAVERAGNTEVVKLERFLSGLISIVSVEPLLGFLGTITGLIRAFMAWEKAGANITVSALASGIYEAMLTTAAGLIVAIPFFLIYNYFISRIKYTSIQLNDYSTQLLHILAEISEKKR